MTVADRIIRYVQALAGRLRVQVLDYVRSLRVRTDQADDIEWGWTEGSLAQAMRGLENEEEPEYSRADLKELFS